MLTFNLVPSNYEMWRAYLLAPAVTPIIFVLLVLFLGMNISIDLIAFGFLACYLVAGLIGMPIAFLLRKRQQLNAWTIHIAALGWGVLWSLFCSFASVYAVAAIGGSIESISITILCFLALMVPPVVLAGSAFWILLKNPRLM